MQKFVALDIETVGLHPYNGTIWMLSYFNGKKTKVWHDCFGKVEYFKEIRPVLEDPSICKVIQNAEFDGAYIELTTGIHIRNIWDTRLCEQVIIGLSLSKGNRSEELSKKYSSSLKYMVMRYGLPEMDKSIRTNFIDRPKGLAFTKPEIKYAAYDTEVLLPIRNAQEFLLTRDSQLEVGLLENKVVEKVIQMKVLGLGFDPNIWKKITIDNQKRYEELTKKLSNKVSNWNSPKQVKDYFSSKGIPINSFDELQNVLTITNNDELRVFIESRDLFTQISKYGLSWLKFPDTDGRIRCSFEQILATGRFAVSNPPIHGLKTEGLHRSAFIPAKGKVFVLGDFAGQEIGIMAAAANEKIWIDALLRHDDIHALTASIVFRDKWNSGKEKGCVFPKKCKCKAHLKYRQDAKINNFMLAYGGGVKKFMEQTGYDEITAKQIVKQHKRAIPSIVRWLEKNARNAVRTGVSYSADPYQRRRVLKDEDERWKIENKGKNNPVQAAGANMVKLAMISIPDKYPIVFVWHDEIILEVPKEMGKEAAKMLKNVMEKTADYITGIKGLISVEPRITNNLMKQ